MTPLPAPPDISAHGWRWWTRAAGLILHGTTWRVALPIALVVGTTLALVNQGAELISGDADAATVLRLIANDAIPYIVSSAGYLSARTGETPTPPGAHTDPPDGDGAPRPGGEGSERPRSRVSVVRLR